MAIQRFLDDVRHVAARCDLLAEPGHGLVRLLQGQRLGAGNAQALVPVGGMAVRAGNHEPMHHAQVDGPLAIEAEVPISELAAQHVAAAGLLP